jgi:L-asparaginase/N4-(beta-N-acetylglucosaminyl)-L-asparaginase
MRNGMTPEQACNATLARIVSNIPDSRNQQVGYIAVNKKGEIGAASLHPGFNYAVKSKNTIELREADAWYKKL